MKTLRASALISLALATLLAGLVATTAVPAQAAVTAPAASPRAIQKHAALPFFKACRKSPRFNERRINFTVDAVFAARCALTRLRGIKLVSSYYGHHPSAAKAIDIMINMSGSCRAGRDTGNDVAHYFMNHARQHRVRYLIWKNSYWASTSRPLTFNRWRHGITGGSCTTRHYDHVHVAFR